MLLIASGKGGVGKSSVTTNLAVALAQRATARRRRRRRRVGVLDPAMLGIDQPPVVIDDVLVPPEANGVRCISMGFFAQEDQPVIWRGPMLHKALEQFLTDVYWDEPDYLVVDLPPGTGDISLSLAQFLPRPRSSSSPPRSPPRSRSRSGPALMAEKVNLEVRGVIENMSWFTGDDGKRYELFGAGGGRRSPTGSACRSSARCRSCPSCARAATSASPSWPPTPTARRHGRSPRSPSGWTTSWRPPSATTPS